MVSCWLHVSKRAWTYGTYSGGDLFPSVGVLHVCAIFTSFLTVVVVDEIIPGIGLRLMRPGKLAGVG